MMKAKRDEARKISLKAGMRIRFTPTDTVFTLAKVTETRVSWGTPPHPGQTGRNTMRRVWLSINGFRRGIEKGIYEIIDSEVSKRV